MSKASKIPGASPEIIAKLEESDPALKQFVIALHKVNEKLNQRIASLEAQNGSLNNRVKALEEYRLPETAGEAELLQILIPTLVGLVRDAGSWAKFCKANRVNPKTSLFIPEE